MHPLVEQAWHSAQQYVRIGGFVGEFSDFLAVRQGFELEETGLSKLVTARDFWQ
jgi:hypothetical protein